MKQYQGSDLNNIYIKRPYKRKRESSYDRLGGNDDNIVLKPGETRTFATIKGPAVITHFWCTCGNKTLDGGSIGHEEFNMRKVILRIYWDDEKNPSVEAPIGDFFGMGHGINRNFSSAVVEMSPLNGHALNCWLPMPFAKSARFELVNECLNNLIYYFYLDYEEVDKLPEDSLYLHAQWRREFPTKGKDEKDFKSHSGYQFGEGPKDYNTSGDENYVILEAKGSGQYVGCNLNIANCGLSANWDWYGEGDDMIFVDGEKWPPNIHGTGTEDYFNTAWSPTESWQSMYHGLIVDEKSNFKGKHTYYRYHVKDPIPFDKSIRVTIEHGHNNNRSDDFSSTAYWYQAEPHMKYPKMLPVKKRMPLNESSLLWNSKVEYCPVTDKLEFDS